ncbi:MotA/TolQ/ExbB proton channel family protein [candidate division WOR-3 bacterium]|nr:MotA/TolQ/ExbB proton channel family protein [candidate division WOR-3 bacterium]
MSVLAIFSIWSWAIFFKKLFEFSKVKRLSEIFFSNYYSHQDIQQLENMGYLLNDSPYGRILESGIEEYKKLKASKPMPSFEQNTKKENPRLNEELFDNIRLAMERTKITEISELETSLPVLSTFVSVSPFLGLLGTVWGIMKAFLEIRVRGSAHITIVAPGISDALITTVYGLLVAIPALIFYNIFRSRLNNFDSEFNKFISEVFVRFRKDI